MDSLSKTKCLWMYVFHYLEDRYRTITVYSKNIGQTIENKCKNGFVLHDWLTSFDFALGGEHQLLGCFSYATVWMSVHHESEWLCLLGECVEFHTLCAVQSVLGHRLIRFCSPFVNHADLVWVARWSTSAFLVLCLCVHMPDGWCVCVKGGELPLCVSDVPQGSSGSITAHFDSPGFPGRRADAW